MTSCNEESVREQRRHERDRGTEGGKKSASMVANDTGQRAGVQEGAIKWW